MLKRSDRTVVFLIFVVALVLRVAGIQHGFPFIFHPDEATIVRSALEIRFFPNPGHFDWPHLYIYFNYFVFMGFAKLRDLIVSLDFKAVFSGAFPLMFNDDLIFYFITRTLTALFGALTIIPVYLTGKNIFSSRVGLLAAFTFAILPFHVWHSHYSLPDVPMVFLVAWAMYFSSQILVKNSPSDYAGAGFYSGLAASTKYNGGLSAVMVPVAHFIRILKSLDEELIDLKNIMNLIISGLLAVSGFLVGTPYAVLDYKTFTRTDGPKGSLWQFKNVGSVDWGERIPKFFNEMLYKVSDDTGYIILAVYFFLFLLLLYKTLTKRLTDMEKNLWFIYLPSLFFLLYISGFETSRSHYYLIAYPMLAVSFGYFAALLYEALERKFKRLSFIALTLLFLLPAYYSFINAITFINGDTRNIMHTWLQQSSQGAARVVYTDSSLDQVLKTPDYTVQKGYDKLQLAGAGYLVVAYSDKDLPAQDRNELKKYDTRLTPAFSINSANFLGPNILIYNIKP